MSLKYNRVTLLFSQLRFNVLKRFYKKIIIGASGIGMKGFLKTEHKYFDVEYSLPMNNLKEIIAEHVWEHLDFPSVATKWCYEALANDGSLIVAVPANETPEEYARDKHKFSFTQQGLTDMFKKQGFRTVQVVDDDRIRRSNSLIIRGIK